jgi:hypothetical protein
VSITSVILPSNFTVFSEVRIGSQVLGERCRIGTCSFAHLRDEVCVSQILPRPVHRPDGGHPHPAVRPSDSPGRIGLAFRRPRFRRSWVSTSRDTEHCSHFSEVRIGGQVLGADCPNDVVVIVAPPKIGFVLACLSFNVGDSLRQWSAQGSGGTGQSAVVGPCCIRFMQSAVSPSWSAVDVGDLARVCAVLPLAQGELDGGCLRSWCALDLWSLTSLDTFVFPLRTGDHSA